MKITRFVPVALAAALVVGCTSSKNADDQAIDQPAGSLQVVAELRAAYQAVNPNTRVGYVNAELPGAQLVSVTDVPVEDFHPGDAITFINAQQQTIATGRVVNVVDNAVHVKYTPGERAPTVGDIAIKFVR